jgi:hypothetical protein
MRPPLPTWAACCGCSGGARREQKASAFCNV